MTSDRSKPNATIDRHFPSGWDRLPRQDEVGRWVLARHNEGWPGTRIARELAELGLYKGWSRASVNNHIQAYVGARKGRTVGQSAPVGAIKAKLAALEAGEDEGAVVDPEGLLDAIAAEECSPTPEPVTLPPVVAVPATYAPRPPPKPESDPETPDALDVPEDADLATYEWLIRKCKKGLADAEEAGNSALAARWAGALNQTVAAKIKATPEKPPDVNTAPDYVKLAEKVEADLHRMLAIAIDEHSKQP